jgi:homoprotocatechuate degradation regulator HpaR
MSKPQENRPAREGRAHRSPPSPDVERRELKLREYSRSLPMALLRAREAVMRQFRPSLRALDLTEQQWRVLRALGSALEFDATSLANATFLLAPSLTRILRDLEKRALIERSVSAADLRTSRLSLSAAGRALLDEAGVHSERIYRRMTTHIGEERLEALMVMLADLERQLQEPLDVAPPALSARRANRVVQT